MFQGVIMTGRTQSGTTAKASRSSRRINILAA